MRAFVLAAGLGTRLRPLTDFVPKPLVRVGDMPLVERAIRQLVAAGIDEIGVNVFYRPEPIVAYIGDGSRFGAKVTWFDERDANAGEPLGTGGGLKNAESWLLGGGDAFMLVNGDAWHTFELASVASAHNPEDIATMVVHIDRRRPEIHTLECREDGSMTGITARPPATFDELVMPNNGFRAIYSGVAVYSSRLLGILPNAKVSGLVTHGIQPALRNGERIAWNRAEGLWIDCGTVSELQRADIFARSLPPIG